MRGGRAPGAVAYAVVAVSLALLALVGAVAVPAADDEGAVIAILAAAAALSAAGGLAVERLAGAPASRLARAVRRLQSGEEWAPPTVSGDAGVDAVAEGVGEVVATQRQQLDRAAAERGRLEEALAAAADVVIAVDGEERVVYANPAAGSVLTGRAGEALGRPLLAVLSDYEVHDLVSRALAAGQGDAPPQVAIRRDERHYQVTARPVVGGGPWAAVLVMQDVTPAQEAEATRREFVANVSHELRTPLAAISAATETLETGLSGEDSKRFHAIIHREADKMAQLVEEMLDLARLESGLAQPQIAPVDVGLVARGALERVRPQAERAGLRLALVCEQECVVEADADLVQRALGNLLHNALKFTPPPGRVSLEVRREGEVVWLLVHDTGIGIPAEEQGRAFQRFYRADRARRREGTGLGLALVRHIAESHGGTVRVESEVGVGSTFGFSLPQADG